MKTKILRVNLNQVNLALDPGIIEGAKLLKTGRLVAFPTETVYGLGANGLDPKAVKQIFQAKGRPRDNPLILHIAQISQLKQLVMENSQRVQELIKNFWPGPLTLVLKKKPLVPDQVTCGLETVAVRMPAHPIARELIFAANLPIAAPSANLSGRPSPTLAKHVINDLNGRIEMIIDGGPSEKGIESTVIDLSTEQPILLRPGSISVEELRFFLPDLKLDISIGDQSRKCSSEAGPRSPGMKYRHYSPQAELVLIEGKFSEVKAKLINLIESSRGQLGLLLTEEMDRALETPPSVVVKIMGSRSKPEEVAERLFKLLREFDEEDVELIFVEGLSSTGMGLAVMNRLEKAAGDHILRV